MSRADAASEPRFQVTLAQDIASIPDGSSERTAFETAFVTDMAAALGVDASTIRILSVTAGSVAVTFEVVSPPASLDVADVLATSQPMIAGAAFEWAADVSYSPDVAPPPAAGGAAASTAASTANAAANAAARPAAATVLALIAAVAMLTEL